MALEPNAEGLSSVQSVLQFECGLVSVASVRFTHRHTFAFAIVVCTTCRLNLSVAFYSFVFLLQF